MGFVFMVLVLQHADQASVIEREQAAAAASKLRMSGVVMPVEDGEGRSDDCQALVIWCSGALNPFWSLLLERLHSDLKAAAAAAVAWLAAWLPSYNLQAAST